MSSHPEYDPALRSRLNAIGKVLSQQWQVLKRQKLNPMLSAEAKRKAVDNFNAWRDKYMDALAPMLAKEQGARPAKACTDRLLRDHKSVQE